MSKLINHLNECPFLPIPCPLKCVHEKEGVKQICKIERNLIGQHELKNCSMRLVACDFCNEEVRACEVNSHLEKCEHFLVSCPFACTEGVKVKRKDVPSHLANSCPLHVVNCPFLKFGCGVVLPRSDLEQHEKDACYLHNRMMCPAIWTVCLKR